jgi:hypothetical protein
VAADSEQYIDVAVRLATDRPFLDAVRQRLLQVRNESFCSSVTFFFGGVVVCLFFVFFCHLVLML